MNYVFYEFRPGNLIWSWVFRPDSRILNSKKFALVHYVLRTRCFFAGSNALDKDLDEFLAMIPEEQKVAAFAESIARSQE